jgi:hypothetical protein
MEATVAVPARWNFGLARFGALGHAGSGPLSRRQPSLGNQSGISCRDCIPRDTEVHRECARRRQPGPGSEAPGAHGLPQRRHQPGPQPGPGQFDVQVGADCGNWGVPRIGPLFPHRNGPYPCAIRYVPLSIPIVIEGRRTMPTPLRASDSHHDFFICRGERGDRIADPMASDNHRNPYAEELRCP